MGKEFNSHRVGSVHQHGRRFIVPEVKMICGYSPKAKAIQSRVRQQNNCPSFVNKTRRLAYRRNRQRLCRFTRVTVSIKHGPLTVDYELGIKHGLKYKTRTEHYGLFDTDLS